MTGDGSAGARPADGDAPSFLRGLWYFALPSAALPAGALVPRTILGEPVVFARRPDGQAFALRDICPHRGIPLSDGRLDRGEVECCYHGWRFAPDGVCTTIPSLVEGQEMDIARIRVRGYALHEGQGCVWIHMPERRAGRLPAPEAMPAAPLPALPGFAARPAITEQMDFPCHVDHAVIGLMDPAHGPFVHRAWWWRSRRSIHAKAKRFGPSALGFTMQRHAPSGNSAAYRLLGGAPATEIAFRLPGIRQEHIIAGRHQVCGLTAVTPIDADTTRIHHLIWWTMPWLTLFRPLLRPFARAFLGQDRDIVTKQQRGLRHRPALMLINDADTQAKWYLRLKRAWAAAQREGRPFENPLSEAVLRWRS